MSYFEAPLPTGTPRPALTIRPGHLGVTDFDVDYFGQDDGRESAADPNRALRLIFQLGSGFMIYLYVIGIDQPGRGRSFHSFWMKDCAVAYVDQDEFGPPEFVAGGPLELPVIFNCVRIIDANATTAIDAQSATSKQNAQNAQSSAITYTIDHCEFTATNVLNQSQPNLEMRWQLTGDDTLCWNNRAGWSLATRENQRSLVAGERVLFSDHRAG